MAHGNGTSNFSIFLQTNLSGDFTKIDSKPSKRWKKYCMESCDGGNIQFSEELLKEVCDLFQGIARRENYQAENET